MLATSDPRGALLPGEDLPVWVGLALLVAGASLWVVAAGQAAIAAPLGSEPPAASSAEPSAAPEPPPDTATVVESGPRGDNPAAAKAPPPAAVQPAAVAQPPADKPCAPAPVFHFQRGRTGLANPDVAVVETLARWLEDRPDAEIVVEAHASADGSPAQNLRVSHARGRTVRKILVDHGIAPERITVQAFGEYRPSTGGDDQANRRAVVRVAKTPICDGEGTR